MVGGRSGQYLIDTYSPFQVNDTVYLQERTAQTQSGATVHGDSIELISVPHTVLAEQSALASENEIVIDEKYNHMLTRGMGIKETVEADVCENQCFKNNYFV